MRTHSSKAAIKSEARNPKHEANSNDRNPNVQNKSRAKTLIQVVVVLLALALSLSACAGKSASPQYYVLSPLPQSNPGATEGETIGVFPVTMPEYLDRPQIVTRVSGNEISFDQFSRWAEPLSENFYNVLIEDLSTLLNNKKIVKTTESAGVPMALQVRVKVVQFDGVLGGDVTLNVTWGLFGEEGKKLLLAKRSSFKEPTGAATYVALVAAESRVVAALSREIADAIRTQK